MIRRDESPVCIGQKQKWFLLKIKTNVENKIDFNHTKSPEFDFWKWVSYWYPIRQVVVFKRDVYRKVLKEFMVSALPRNITPNGKLKGCARSNGDSRTRRKFC